MMSNPAATADAERLSANRERLLAVADTNPAPRMAAESGRHSMSKSPARMCRALQLQERKLRANMDPRVKCGALS